MSLAKMLVIPPLALGALLVPAASAQVRSATITGAVTGQPGAVAANAEVVITNTGTNVSVAGFAPCETGLAIATDQTHRVDVNLKVGTVGATVEVAAQSAKIQPDSSAVTNATDAQVINVIPNVTQNPLLYSMLQNGVQPHNQTSTSPLGDL